jgi:hypothetical protein
MIAEFNAQTSIGASDVIRQSHCPNGVVIATGGFTGMSATHAVMPDSEAVRDALARRYCSPSARRSRSDFSSTLPPTTGAPQKNNNPVN